MGVGVGVMGFLKRRKESGNSNKALYINVFHLASVYMMRTRFHTLRSHDENMLVLFVVVQNLTKTALGYHIKRCRKFSANVFLLQHAYNVVPLWVSPLLWYLRP